MLIIIINLYFAKFVQHSVIFFKSQNYFQDLLIYSISTLIPCGYLIQFTFWVTTINQVKQHLCDVHHTFPNGGKCRVSVKKKHWQSCVKFLLPSGIHDMKLLKDLNIVQITAYMRL